MFISLSKILRKNVSPNAWALTAQIRSQFNWPCCSMTLQKAWKLVLMGSCYTMRRTGLKQCHWSWIQSECSCNICDAILGSPRAYLWRGGGVLAAAQYGDGGESRDSCHCNFSVRWQGLFLHAGLHSHDCIQRTLVAERCSSSEAQSRALGREGSREPHISP